MKTSPILKAVVIALACAGLASAGGGKKDADAPMPLVVPKPESCGPNDRPETALQGLLLPNQYEQYQAMQEEQFGGWGRGGGPGGNR